MQNLKKLRLAKGLSQAQIAQFLHIGSSTVCRWELGETKPTLCQFLQLCRVLDCTPGQLFDSFSADDIPVFDPENKFVTKQLYTAQLKDCGCSFGLALPFDIPPRLKKGDICYFALCSTPETDKLCLAFDDNYNEYLYFFKESDENLYIIAICRFIHTAL